MDIEPNKNTSIELAVIIPVYNEEEVISVSTKLGFPIVLKADGLAAGKGVIICHNQSELDDALDIMFMDKKFGNASDKLCMAVCWNAEPQKYI